MGFILLILKVLHDLLILNSHHSPGTRYLGPRRICSVYHRHPVKAVAGMRGALHFSKGILGVLISERFFGVEGLGYRDWKCGEGKRRWKLYLPAVRESRKKVL